MLKSVLMGMPRYSCTVNMEAASGFFRSVRPDSPIQVNACSPQSSLLAASFNQCWALAWENFEDGAIDGFAMLHADVGPEQFWIDLLEEERDRVGADLISVVVPIKDNRGLTSTAVDDTGDPWRVRRLTTKEVFALPETFTADDVGAPLMLNTGIWLCKLGPWCTNVWFTIKDCIRREGPEGRWHARVQSEDWDFSRQCLAQGLKIAATRKVKVGHWGEQRWGNQTVHGWDSDQTNNKQTIEEARWPSQP